MARVKQGEGYRVSTVIQQRNLDGTLTKVDPGGIAGTLLLPDQTTTPFTPTKDAVGEYHADLSPLTLTSIGHYQWKVVTTGVGAGVQDGAFDVVDPFASELLSLEDARQILNLTTDDSDAELEVYLAAVTEAIEAYIGPVGRRTVTETVYPESGVLELSTKPILAITSVTPYAGLALSGASYTLTPGGYVVPAVYAAGFYSAYYTVVYTAGRASVPPAVNLAARKTLKHLWSPDQYGASGLPRAGFGGEEADLGGQAFAFVTSYGVRELLAPHKLAPATP